MNYEQGYSLVEVLVSLAILSAVLVPTVAFIAYAAGYPMNQDKIKALSLGRTEMEQTLSAKSESDSIYVADDRYMVYRKVEREQNLVFIDVKVFRKDTTQVPLINFKTSRLWYQD